MSHHKPFALYSYNTKTIIAGAQMHYEPHSVVIRVWTLNKNVKWGVFYVKSRSYLVKCVELGYNFYFNQNTSPTTQKKSKYIFIAEMPELHTNKTNRRTLHVSVMHMCVQLIQAESQNQCNPIFVENLFFDENINYIRILRIFSSRIGFLYRRFLISYHALIQWTRHIYIFVYKRDSIFCRVRFMNIYIYMNLSSLWVAWLVGGM